MELMATTPKIDLYTNPLFKRMTEEGGFKVLDENSLAEFLKLPGLFDCCDFHAAPGSKAVLKDGEISVWTSTKLSPHQDGMNDLLAAAALRGASPEHIAVVGFQPVLLDDYGGSISDKAKSLIPEAVEDGAAVLKAWGVGIRERTPDEAVPPLRGTECLDIRTYEAGRPSAEAACRSGDERFARFISKKE